jgi:hypothetical protein
MAWPFSRRTTYVPNTTPSIKAADLNALQDAIIALYGLPMFFGNGADGALASASGNTTLTTNKNYTTVALSGTASLLPNSHIVRASTSIALVGTSDIKSEGVPGTDDSTTAGGGAGDANQTLGNGGNGGAGDASGAGTAGGSKTNTSLGGSGGAGGAGSNGAGGAGGVASINGQLDHTNLIAYLTGQLFGYNGTDYGPSPIQGGGGGGGGGDDAAGSGYGGGGGGGVIILISPIISIGAGCSIRANGGAGASNMISPGNGGGGGGGGGGGCVILVYQQLIETGSIAVAGGAAGSGGSNGVAGSTGTIVRKVLLP